ncbi:MAG: response regulator [Blastochloris sp.]|nr:response regulator [Blastochloris sp.]
MGHTILAIDDSPTLRKFISKHLSAHSSSYEILTAADGTEGLKLASERKPDLILLDFILPDMNGEDVCNKLKESDVTAGIPIVLMSSSAPDITRTEAKFDIIKRSLVKPFSPQLLCAAVSALLKGTEAQGKSDANPARSGISTSSAAAHPEPESMPTMLMTRRQKPSEADPSPARIRLKGSSSYFPLISALRGINEKAYTGLLRFSHNSVPMEIYFKSGLFVLATTRDCDAYFKDAPIAVLKKKNRCWKNSKRTKKIRLPRFPPNVRAQSPATGKRRADDPPIRRFHVFTGLDRFGR